jgi:hypothetical protein
MIIVGLSVACIRTDAAGGGQLHEDIVHAYHKRFLEGAEVPPVVAFRDGETYWLADGFDLLEAAKRAGQARIKADVRRGTCRDAILFAAGARSRTGLDRTKAHKREVIETLLADEEWRCWSDARIAKHTRVSEKFVANVRSKCLAAAASNPPPTPVAAAVGDLSSTAIAATAMENEGPSAAQEPTPAPARGDAPTLKAQEHVVKTVESKQTVAARTRRYRKATATACANLKKVVGLMDGRTALQMPFVDIRVLVQGAMKALEEVE